MEENTYIERTNSRFENLTRRLVEASNGKVEAFKEEPEGERIRNIFIQSSPLSNKEVGKVLGLVFDLYTDIGKLDIRSMCNESAYYIQGLFKGLLGGRDIPMISRKYVGKRINDMFDSVDCTMIDKPKNIEDLILLKEDIAINYLTDYVNKWKMYNSMDWDKVNLRRSELPGHPDYEKGEAK